MEPAIPILPAEDLATAKAFYVNGLGFRVTFEASEDGRPGLLGIERGTIQMTLESDEGSRPETPVQRSRWTTSMPATVSGARRWTFCELRKMRCGARVRSTCSTHPATPSS
jgi:hypothetical protein